MVKIIKNSLGMNARCFNCGYEQPGLKSQPINLYYKIEGERRGHNTPMCCVECANEYVSKNGLK